MTTEEKKLELLKTLSTLDPDRLTRDEFVNSFKHVLQLVSTISESNKTEWVLIQSAFQMFSDRLQENTSAEMSKTKEEIKVLTQKFTSLLESKVKEVDQKLASVKNGLDADEEKIVSEVLSQIKFPEQKAQILDTPEEIRNKLEVLEEDERLDISFIKGFEDKLKKFAKKSDVMISGRGPLWNLQDVDTTGLQVNQALKWDGVKWIPFTPSGAGLSVLAATGTINDSNKTFTFASSPTFVVVNGAMYIDGSGVTIVTTTATLDNPVGTGGSIFGLG